MSEHSILRKAFLTTIPVFLGYTAIGLAFGLLVHASGYQWYITLCMSIFIYAGAAQYIGIGMLAAGAGFAEIAVVTFLVNARHMVYGLSIMEKFRHAGPYKSYLVFALTDETYALLTSVPPPEHGSTPRFYFFVSLLNHLYWLSASVVGFFIGKLIPFSTEGLGFALTALFVVLLTEQWKLFPKKLPFLIAAATAVGALLLLGKTNMLIASTAASILILLLVRNKLNHA